MNKKLNIKFSIIIALISIIIPFSNVNAAPSTTISITGSSSVNINTDFSVDIEASAPTGGGKIVTIGGSVNVADESCVKFVSLESLSDNDDFNNKKFSYQINKGTSNKVSIIRVKLRSQGTACTTTVNATNVEISFDDGTELTQNLATKTINVSVPVPKSTDATLKNLVADKGTISPTFASATTSYTLNVPEGTAKVNFTATVNDSKATIQSGASCTLTGETTNCNIVVKAESGATKTYTVKVTRPRTPSSDATLKTLVPDKGTLSPAFSSSSTEYVLDVPEGTEEVNFTPTVKDANAKVKSGEKCSLTGDTTECKIVVEAEDGSTKTYTVKVNKPSAPPVVVPPEASADATLKALDVSGYTLSPKFNSDTTNYTMNVANTVTGLVVDAVPTDPDADVKIEGNLGWQEGINVITITVTATDGTKKVYTVNVNRKVSNPPSTSNKAPLSSDNYLQSLIPSDGTLSPNFDKNISNYQITVPRGTTSIKFDAITSSSAAKVKIEGNENLKIGYNTVLVTVTAEDGSKRTYSINVYRSEQEGDNLLKDLIVEGNTISPTFDPNVNEYEVTVGNVDEINVKALTQNPNAKVEIIGNKNLQEGRNLVQVKVTDENGFTKTYFLYVNKKSKKTFLGLTLGQWLTLLGILLLLGLLLFIIFLLLKKKDKEKEKKVEQHAAPVIEFKPEFNFGSKNGTDDDVVNEGGVLNQYSGIMPESKIPEAPSPKVIEAQVDNVKEIPYDPYDEVVTKDELFDAIEEARETRDPSKLRILYEQELLNRKKAELKAQEERNRRR